MADKITTLHPENDTSINLYPNVKEENIPNTIARVSYVDEGDNENDLAISAVRSDLDTEIADRKKDTADTNGRIDGLATDISILDTRITGLSDAVTDINNELTEEVTNRENADTVLKENILDLYRMVIRSGGTITVTDASVALASQPFPLTVSPKALLDYVGGMCQQVNQLRDTDSVSGTGSILVAPVTKVVFKGANGSVEKEYPIPVEVQALDGYGWGINEECNNYVHFERKKYVKKVAKVDLGTLNYGYHATHGYFYTNSSALLNYIKFITNGEVINQQNDLGYKSTTYYGISEARTDNAIAFYNDGSTRFLCVKDTSKGTDPIAFKAAMSGVFLYYELANHVETDISQYLDRDLPDNDVIEVTAGGYLEFENANNIGVAYSVTYQSKAETQGEGE